jgi:hypothetical protein
MEDVIVAIFRKYIPPARDSVWKFFELFVVTGAKKKKKTW